MFMADKKNSFNDDLKELIREQLDEAGIASELIHIDFDKKSRIVLSGELYSEYVHRTILQITADAAGYENVVDRLIVMDAVYDEIENDPEDRDSEVYDEDEDFVGTEDVFRSIEDGIPYIPPSKPPRKGLPNNLRWKRRKKNTK